MRRVLLVGLLVVALGWEALTQSFNLTVTITAGDRAKIQTRVGRLNAASPAPVPPWTPQTFTQDALAQCLTLLLADEDQISATDASERFKRATPAQRAAALAVLP